MLNFRMEEIPCTIPIYSLVNASETVGLKFQLLPQRGVLNLHYPQIRS